MTNRNYMSEHHRRRLEAQDREMDESIELMLIRLRMRIHERDRKERADKLLEKYQPKPQS